MSRPTFVNLIGALTTSVLVLAGAGCTRDNATAAPVGGGGADPNSRVPCQSNAECAGGQICTTIGCCPGCHSDADCAADSQCVVGSPNFCAPKTASNPKPVPGDPTVRTPGGGTNPVANNVNPSCLGDSDCVRGQVCNVGKCTAACTASSCGAGNSCISGRCYGSGASACGTGGLVLCTASAQCGAGRSCVNGGCHLACSASTQCSFGQECSNGICADQARPTVSQCVFDADCGTAFRCINAACHPLCASDDQCGTNNLCDHGVCRANNRPLLKS